MTKPNEPQDDPAEGARDVIDRELARADKSSPPQSGELEDVPAAKGPKTGGNAPAKSDVTKMSKKEIDKRLDHALEESFPGSDPVSFDVD